MCCLLISLFFAGLNPQTAPASFALVPRPAVVVVSATGVGYPPRHMRGAQARLMARRAAEVTAVRNLAIKLGLPPHVRMGSFRYVLARNLPGGGVEVTVETLANARPVPAGSAPTRRGR